MTNLKSMKRRCVLPLSCSMPVITAGATLPRPRRVAFPRAIVLAAAVALTCGPANAKVQLSKIFGSNMVIQRGQPVSIWGTCSANSKVQINLGAEGASAVSGRAGAPSSISFASSLADWENPPNQGGCMLPGMLPDRILSKFPAYLWRSLLGWEGRMSGPGLIR